jgi:transcription antitermination factor NusG
MDTQIKSFSEPLLDPGQIAGALSLDLPWHAVRVRSKCEFRVLAALLGKGYEAYLPLYRKRSRWSDRLKNIDLVLFPGYVFCRLDVARRLPLLVTPGVVDLVGFGGVFPPIPNSELEAVRRVIASGLPSMPSPFLREGQRVRIRCGALKDVEGVLIHSKTDCRLVISVNLLQRSVSVEIDRELVEPVNHPLPRA